MRGWFGHGAVALKNRRGIVYQYLPGLLNIAWDHPVGG
jgi:hypothetical protein